MISVQNLQQLLSGSRILVLVFVMAMIASCGTSEKATSRKSTGRSTFPKKKKRRKATKVDTVKWTEVDTKSKEEKANDLKSSNKDSKSEMKSSYNVSMLIPLEAREYNNTGNGNLRMINYYAGVKMALDQLEEDGVNLALNTIDVGGSGNINSKLREAKSSGADVIIGPYDKNDLKTAAKFAKDNEITLVSPWISSSLTTDDNPHYVQLKPSLLDHYQRMMEHVSENYKPEQVVLLAQLGNRTDQKKAAYFQKLAKVYYKSKEAKPLTEYFIPQDSLIQSRMLFYEYLKPKETTVFLLPNMNSRDESFIYGAIRRLTAERGESKVVVYGMPIVLDSEKLTFDNYNGTSAHVVTSSFVDKKDSDILSFKRRFYDIYGGIPTDEAYEGYDMMLYIGNALKDHGTKFQFDMNRDYDDLLQTSIALYPKYKNGGEDGNNNDDIEYFANKNVEVIYFKDNRFQRKD